MNFIDGFVLFSIISIACCGFIDLVYEKGYSIEVIKGLIWIWFYVGIGYFLIIITRGNING